MEPSFREPREMEAGQGRALTGEKSPAGSVKRARQRAAAGLPSEQRPQMLPSPTSTLPNPYMRTPPPISSSGRGPNPQLPAGNDGQPQSLPRDRLSGFPNQRHPGQERSMARGPPPQRPPRPTFVPPLPNSSQPPRNYWEDSSAPDGYSNTSRPPTITTGSSIGGIPDFPDTSPMSYAPSMPVPTYQPPSRRNLGPPPSARKGGSGYYSQNSFVPPIPEEMSESHSSYASSHAIPISWGDGPPEYYMGAGINDDDESLSQGDSGRGSRAGDHDESSVLVEKRAKSPYQPYPETVESGDESDRGARHTRELDWQMRQDERFRPGTDPIGRHNFRNDGRTHPYSGYENDAGFLDSPRSVDPNLMSRGLKPTRLPDADAYAETLTPAESPIDPRIGEILGHLEKGGALASSETTTPSTSTAPSMNAKGPKRPTRLNLEPPKAVRRGNSATSLPELIRRATRLASNLDRGKTASRIGMLEVLNANDKEKRGQAGRKRSISDMLNAFPSPSSTATSPGHRPKHWPTSSPYEKSNLSRAQTINYGSERSIDRRGRRCCGMPMWAFVLLVIILLLLIAAAVIIPVTLVVLPHQRNLGGPGLADCQHTNACANGGTSIIVNKTCRCICANGFTGSTCTSSPDGGCTTTTTPLDQSTTSYHNATLGSAIPRLVTAAQSNFSIPMSGYKLLSLFSSTNLSCTSENALVTFNQKAQKQRRNHNQVYNHIPLALVDPPLHAVAVDQVLQPSPATTQTPTPVLSARDTPQTSNSIIFAAPSGAAGLDPAASGTPTSPSSTSPGSNTITQQTLDFARTAVLFIFQETGSLNTATMTLDKLQNTLVAGLGGRFDANQTNAGGDLMVDLSRFTVGFGNGTLFGGKGGS